MFVQINNKRIKITSISRYNDEGVFTVNQEVQNNFKNFQCLGKLLF